MDGRKFRFHDNHEFFHAACSVNSRRQSSVQVHSVSRSQRLPGPPQESRKHCTAGEIAIELGYSISYILAVKKAMYPELVTLPRRLDPKELLPFFAFGIV
ncbi:MAG: hypothetical protein JWM99_4922 [Verrucomicrobiales bacterium]|nr:hypothetical protein [Verrucomicrobiales bacterium]